MRVVIIGAGVAGLACGCYLQMNGYEAEILEANPLPGGLCVAWDRGPYVFDGCLRWLLGTHPSSKFHRIWRELGALGGRQVINDDEFLRVESANGRVLSVSPDLEQFSRDAKEFAPEDASRIDKLVRAAKICAPLEPLDKPLELLSTLERIKVLIRYFPILMTLLRWKNKGLGAYLAGYRNPFLRETLEALAGDGRMSALVLVMVLGWRARRNAGYVVGGSRAFVRAIARRYARLGGAIRCNTRVVSVIVEDNRAVGVRCADGTRIPATVVVSCADGRATLFKMLEGRYLNKASRYAYRHGEVFPAVLQASLGVNRTFPEICSAISLPLSPPLQVDDTTRHKRLEVAVLGSDSGLCPAGKSILIVRLASRYDYWANLRERDPDSYAQKKQALLQEIGAVLDRRFAGLSRQIEQADLATPATFARFTGNWQGSIQGWLPTPRTLGRRLPRALPGLDGFFMAGHWIETGGGLPSAALSGRYAAQMICNRDGKEFRTVAA